MAVIDANQLEAAIDALVRGGRIDARATVSRRRREAQDGERAATPRAGIPIMPAERR